MMYIYFLLALGVVGYVLFKASYAMMSNRSALEHDYVDIVLKKRCDNAEKDHIKEYCDLCRVYKRSA